MNLYYNNAFNANQGISDMLHDVQLVFACDRMGWVNCMEPPYIHGD